MQQLDLASTAVIATARRFADDLAGAFAGALASHKISQAVLFSSKLSPVAGTSPQQLIHQALGLFKSILPPNAACCYAPDKGITQTVATDRNCYVLVHQPAYQQPQRLDDPRFTHSFSCHRCIYDERWTP